MDTQQTAQRTMNILSTAIVIVIVLILCIHYVHVTLFQYTTSELNEFNDIMQYFHTDPDYDDFLKVYNARAQLTKQAGRTIKFWLWGVYIAQPQYYDEAKIAVISPWMREIERALRRARTQPTAELIDCIWGLYFATGDLQYAEVVRRAATSHREDVRQAARRSYKSIIGDPSIPIRGTALDLPTTPPAAPATPPTAPPATPQTAPLHAPPLDGAMGQMIIAG